MNIIVRKIDFESLWERTLRASCIWRVTGSWKDNFDGDMCSCIKNDMGYLPDEWLVNYVRYNLVEYDATCYALFESEGKDKGDKLLKDKILSEIAKVYPNLSGECHKQKNQVDNLM